MARLRVLSGREVCAILEARGARTGLCWRTVWIYNLGGYQAVKKWPSYREQGVFGRPMKPEEVLHFTDTARGIAAILQLVNHK